MSHLRSFSQRSRTPTLTAIASTSGDAASDSSEHGDGPTKKSQRRKSYTLAKKRVYWTEDEHERFLQALEKYGREWKKVEEIVGTKSSVQIRSHAQKYFLKASREDKSFELPPAKIRHAPLQTSNSHRHSSNRSSSDSDSSRQRTHNPLQQPRTNSSTRSAGLKPSFSPVRDKYEAQENMTPPLRPMKAPMEVEVDPLLLLHEMALGCLGTTSVSSSSECDDLTMMQSQRDGPNILRRKRSLPKFDNEPSHSSAKEDRPFCTDPLDCSESLPEEDQPNELPEPTAKRPMMGGYETPPPQCSIRTPPASPACSVASEASQATTPALPVGTTPTVFLKSMSPMQCAFPAYSASTEFIKPTTQQLQRPTDMTVPGSAHSRSLLAVPDILIL